MKKTHDDTSTLLAKLRQVRGDAKAVADAIAELDPDMDDPIVAAMVRKILHGAASDPRHRTTPDSSKSKKSGET